MTNTGRSPRTLPRAQKPLKKQLQCRSTASVAVQTAREEGDSAAPTRGVHPPTRRLVLVGGVSRSQNRFSFLDREEEENEVHVHGQDRQRRMRASQRCTREFSQRSVSATVVDHTVSQNLGSQIRAEEDQPMSGDEVFVDGIERQGASEGEEQEEVPFEAVEDPISGEVQARNVSVGLQSLDEVDLKDIFKRRHEVGLQDSGARSIAGKH